MKKWIIGMLVCLLLAGCGAQEELPVYETVGEGSCVPQAKPAAGQISLYIPQEASQQTMTGTQEGSVYTWGEHTLQLQTLDGGDIQKTVESVTGQPYEMLTVMCQEKNELTWYQTVWSVAGEEGTLLGRALIADDGNYHYCVSLIAPEEVETQEVYDRMCASFAVSSGTGK